MNIGGVVVVEEGRVVGTYCRLRSSLEQHSRELVTIERKMSDPRVPDGKKEKLAFRAKVIRAKVLPRIHSRMEHMQPDVSCY